MIARAWLLAASLAVVVVLSGCSAQNEVVGEGPASLLFNNDGTKAIDVRVKWTLPDGEVHSRSFDLEPDGLVEVRLADLLQYTIRLEAKCDSSVAPAAKPPDPQVIEVGGSSG